MNIKQNKKAKWERFTYLISFGLKLLFNRVLVSDDRCFQGSLVLLLDFLLQWLSSRFFVLIVLKGVKVHLRP